MVSDEQLGCWHASFPRGPLDTEGSWMFQEEPWDPHLTDAAPPKDTLQAKLGIQHLESCCWAQTPVLLQPSAWLQLAAHLCKARVFL